ncbi:MAG: pentapeptide repeat-containing protein, partial [Xanthobacteraceae bacterium]
GQPVGLVGAQLQGAYLREASLQGADLRGARLQGARTGPWRPGFPVRGDHRFRWMTTTCSGRWRPGQQGCGRA